MLRWLVTVCTQKWNCRVMRYIISSTFCDIAKLLTKLYCSTYPHTAQKFHLFHILAKTEPCWTITFLYFCKQMPDVTLLPWWVCMSAKLLQSRLTLWEPTDCSPQAPLSMGIFQARILGWVAMPSPGDIPNPGIDPRSPTLRVESLPSEPPGKPIFP